MLTAQLSQKDRAAGCVIHCAPKKWRQNSNHYSYGISYHN